MTQVLTAGVVWRNTFLGVASLSFNVVRSTVLFAAAFLCWNPVHAGASEGVDAIKRGDYETAYEEFSALADAGDSHAMVTIGMFYYKGDGFEQDYDKAMDWFIRAFKLGNGDAFNNIGVMYRDGLGVTPNRAIAYDLFLLVHMRGLGGQSTQQRANRNLRREVAELGEAQIKYALCLSESQVKAFVVDRGGNRPETYARDGTAIKDREWWLEGDLPDFACD